MPIDVPEGLLAPLVQLGLAGLVIFGLAWALIRKDKQVDRLMEARVQDQRERAADNLKAATTIEAMNQAMKAREVASDERWKVTESVIAVVTGTAEVVKSSAAEINRIGRAIDVDRGRRSGGAD
jgi:hypothetical protein